MTSSLLYLLLYLAKVLFIPVMILALWKKHPVLSYSLAAVVHFAIMIFIIYSANYGLVTAFGGTPPRLPFIRLAFQNATLNLVIFLPVLLVFQLVLRRRFVKRDKHEKKKKKKKKKKKNVFS